MGFDVTVGTAEGFQYENNVKLCGVGLSSLKACSASNGINPRPEPYGAATTTLSTRDIPETTNLNLPCSEAHCLNPPKSHQASIVVGIIVVTIPLSATGSLTFTQYRRRKQKLGTSFDVANSRRSTDQAKGIYRKNGSPLISQWMGSID